MPSGLAATASAAAVTTDPAGSGFADTSIVPELGRTVWNPGIYEGIPTDSSSGRADGCGGATQHGSTIAAGAGLLSTIQAALNAAGAVATKASRRFVKLGPGVFSGLNASFSIPAFVTLRGTMNANGFTRDTVLRFSITNGDMIFMRSDAQRPQVIGEWGPIRTINDAAHGDSTITVVGDISHINVGDIVQIDTLRDGSNAPTVQTDYGALPIVYNPPSDGNWCWAGDSWWDQRQLSGQDGLGGHPHSPNGRRAITECHEVLAKNGQVLTIYNPNAPVIKGSPVRSPMYISPEIHLCRGTSTDVNRYSGIEDLKIEPSSTNGNTVINMDQCAFCWIKNVEIHGDNPNTTFTGPGVWMTIGGQCYRNEIRDCYWHGFDQYGTGGAYGIRFHGSEAYVHNNVFVSASKPIMLEHSGGGNVIAYNYIDDVHLGTTPSWQELAIGTHLAFCHYELIEGNHTPNMGADCTHGNNGWITMFRNYATGLSSFGPATSPARCVNIGGWHREMYSIGNVLGNPALTWDVLIEDQAIQPAGGDGQFPDRCMYLLGWAPVMENLGGTTGGSDQWDNGEAGRNFHRHLDYNVVSASQFDNSANPVKTLPPSLHRTTAPSYFTAGGYAWPWVNPAGGSHATRVMTLPAKARFDAGQA